MQVMVITFNSGYGIETNKGLYYTYESSNIIKIEKYSFGKGIYFNFGFGKEMTSNISGQINFIYFRGSEQDFDIMVSSAVFDYYKFLPKMYGVKPSFIFRTNYSKFNPFIELGIMILKIEFVNKTKIIAPYPSIQEYKFTGSTTLGLSTSLGLDYSINDKISLKIFISNNNLEFIPTESKTEKYTENGEDKLNSLQEYFKTTIYVDRIEKVYGPDLNSPRKMLKGKYPFSSIIFNIGVQYNF